MTSRRLFCKTLMQAEGWRDDVVVEVSADGMIVAIECGDAASADAVLDGIVLPGMPNTHSHSFQRLIAGLTGASGHQHDSFWSWREAMYACAGKITPEQFGATAAWVFTEMLKAGYTSCAEFHYLHHQQNGSAYDNLAELSARVIEAACTSGISLTLLPVLYQTAGFGNTRLDPVQKRFANSTDRYLRLLDDCRVLMAPTPGFKLGIAPHSLRAVPIEALAEVIKAWPDDQCPIHIHIAEQPAEIESCLQHFGKRPLQWLLEQFPLDQRWSLVHATHLSDAELTAAAASGAIAGLCPTTEADLGDGFFRTTDWLQAGGHFSIGSDSNVRISVAEELRQLEYNERLLSGKRNVLSQPDTTCGRFLYQHAAQTGALAVGQPAGRLEPGFRADLVELRADHPLSVDRSADAALDSWVFAGDNSLIQSVWVAGNRLINDGHHAQDESLHQGLMQTLKELGSA